MSFLSDIITPVSTGFSSIVRTVSNPISTVTGFSQGLIRPQVGSPLLQSRPVLAKPKAPSVIGTPKISSSGFLANITKGIGTTFSSAVGGVQSAITRINGTARAEAVKNETLKAQGEIAGRVVDIGLSGLQNLVSRLTGSGGAGNRLTPAPIEGGKIFDSPAIFAQSPGFIPAGASTIQGNPYPQNSGLSNDQTGDAGYTVKDTSLVSGGDNTKIIIAALVLVAVIALFAGRKKRR